MVYGCNEKANSNEVKTPCFYIINTHMGGGEICNGFCITNTCGVKYKKIAVFIHPKETPTASEPLVFDRGTSHSAHSEVIDSANYLSRLTRVVFLTAKLAPAWYLFPQGTKKISASLFSPHLTRVRLVQN